MHLCMISPLCMAESSFLKYKMGEDQTKIMVLYFKAFMHLARYSEVQVFGLLLCL